MNSIQNFLRQTMGLHPASVGSAAIDRVVHARMQSRGLARQEEYLRLLKHSPVEWHALVEAVVVTETWFFRDRQPFVSLVQLALAEWLPAHPAERLRLLSVPCSSGEEPSSMAMALLDAGVPAERFRIDAFDISSRALIAAAEGRYGRNSFRGHDLAFRERHFQATKEGYVLNPAVRKQIRYYQGNLLDENCLGEAGVYDFVFCRNLLIYFDGATQRKVLQKLRRLVAPSGVLFLGPAEIPLALDNGFVSANLPLSFCCRPKPGAGKNLAGRLAPVEPVLQRGRWHRLAAADRSSASARVLPTELAFPGARGTASPGEADLDRAQQLAREGRFAEAAEICEAHLREWRVSARAYYLLGLVRDAVGADSQASEFYRRALYLEPDHYETLKQWAWLSERTGDDERARMLHERAERARKANPENP